MYERILVVEDDIDVRNGLVEVLESEPFGVVPAVARLGRVLREERVGQVAVDAARAGMVARLLPTVVLGAHDVAVGARLGIGAEVREPFGVTERHAPQADGRSDDEGRIFKG